MADLYFLPSQRGNRILVYHDYMYNFRRKNGSISFWRCKHKAKCNARVKTENDVVISEEGTHTHATEKANLMRIQFTEELKMNAVSNSTVPIPRIYK